MTQQSKRPGGKPTASPKIEQDGALPEAALEKVTGGKAQSDMSAKYSQTHDAIAQNLKG